MEQLQPLPLDVLSPGRLTLSLSVRDCIARIWFMVFSFCESEARQASGVAFSRILMYITSVPLAPYSIRNKFGL